MPKSKPQNPALAGLKPLFQPKPDARKAGFDPACQGGGKRPKPPKLTPGRWATPGKSGQR